jgi:hypothetical protein
MAAREGYRGWREGRGARATVDAMIECKEAGELIKNSKRRKK